MGVMMIGAGIVVVVIAIVGTIYAEYILKQKKKRIEEEVSIWK